MKTLKRLQIIAILLFVAIIIFASFFGVYKKEDFRVTNLIKEYKLGMQFSDLAVFTGKVSTEEEKIIHDSEGNVVEDDGETDYSEENGYKVETVAANNEEDLTVENYKLAKKIITKRLKGMDVGEYKIALNEKTGELTIKLQENDQVHEIEEHMEGQGVFTIIDKDTEEVLIDNSQVKSAKVVYGASNQDASTTVIYLQIDFNKEGTKKLEEISQIYVAGSEEQENEDGEKEEVDTTKYINVQLDGQTLSSTYFGEKMSTGVLYVPVTQAKDAQTLAKYVKEISNFATVINNGPLPLEYEFTEDTVEANISQKSLIIGITVPSILLLIACVVLIVKFKIKGLVSTFLQVGYIALLLLAIRYTNVVITVQGIVGIVLSAFLNYAFNYIILNNLNKQPKLSWQKVGRFALYTIPVYVIAVILAFNKFTVVNSLGMCLVWGSFCLYIYNLSITKAALEMLNK